LTTDPKYGATDVQDLALEVNVVPLGADRFA
jgi:hypothetical protein